MVDQVNLEQTSVLVTGGAGYIGSHAVLALREAQWRVAVIDNLSKGARDSIPSDVPFYLGDITDEPLLMRAFQEQSVSAILHFAGSIVVPESIEFPLSYYENNTFGSFRLLQAAIGFGVRHFVFSSTAAVYGVGEKEQVEEIDRTEPINPYGASKLMTERMLADASAAEDFNYAALRYFNVAGADPQMRTGQRVEGSTHLIKVAVEAALGRRNHVSVFGTDYPTPDGTCVRDYIHVSDLAEAHVAALDWLCRNPDKNLVANCGYGRGLSVLEVLDAVDRVSGGRIERVLEGRRPGDPAALIASNERLRTTLNWTPARPDIDTIVADALAWERTLLERKERGGPTIDKD